MSRTAKLKKVHELNYGGRADCEYLMQKVSSGLAAMHDNRNYADELRARTKFLRSEVEYRNDKDTTPIAGALGLIPVTVPGTETEHTVAAVPLEVNVLGDDYWNVNSVLLR